MVEKKYIINPCSGKKIEDLTGRIFGRFTVLYIDEVKTKNKKKIHWVCKCECGNQKSVTGTDLKKGKSKSCGCLHNELLREKNTIRLEGEVFGRLTVEKVAYYKNNKCYWECKCLCGGKKTVATSNLINGRTQSCGCLHYESMGNNIIDLTQQRFGRLTAKKYRRSKDVGVEWFCECDCGNNKWIRSNSLIHGKTTSCGCYQKDIMFEKLFKDLTGQKFNRLTVKKLSGKIKGKYEWICKCECGNEVTVSAGALIKGNTKSCGCYKRDKTKERCIIDITGEVFGFLTVIGYAGTKKTSTGSESKWLCQCICGNKKEYGRSDIVHKGVSSCGCRYNSKRERNSNWKGGISNLGIQVRSKCGTWRLDSLKNSNYTCEITGQVGGDLVVHHKIPFKNILNEAIYNLGLVRDKTCTDYSEAEIESIETECLRLHYQYGLGAVITKELHILFHFIYGKENNTPEQFEEFKKRYKNKEFEEFI